MTIVIDINQTQKHLLQCSHLVHIYNIVGLDPQFYSFYMTQKFSHYYDIGLL